jgi:hypothetical protein
VNEPVYTDDVTVAGDGTSKHPLSVISGGLGFVPSQSGSNTFTADPTHSQWILESNLNDFQSILEIISSAGVATGALHQIAVNTDGQVNYTTYQTGEGFPNNVSSQLRLDQDGTFGLGGGAGGGIGNDGNTGETCIPAPLVGVPSATGTFRVNESGVVSRYLGQGSSGNGIPVFLSTASATGLTGSISNFTVFTTNASGYASQGLYHLRGYLNVTGAGAGATVVVTASYTDDSGANSQSTASLAFAADGANVGYSFIFKSSASAAIKVSITISGGNPTYSSSLNLVPLS